ncbi:MAG: hypothetical protein SF162_06140 [bacterium]|nr:hypothetical protein [bacterium]
MAETQSADKNRLIFQYEKKRSRYVRALIRQVLGIAAVIGAFAALNEARNRGLVDSALLDVGLFAAILLGGLLAIRALAFVYYAVTRRDEEIRFYTKGFVWVRGKEAFKYPYPEIVRFREGGRGLYIGMTPILQWGAHVIEVADGHVFRLRPYHGSLKRFSDRARQPIAIVTAARIAETLRYGKSVQLHRRLTVYPGGVEIGRREIGWREMAVSIKGMRLIIKRADVRRRKFVTAGRYYIPLVDNVGGFYDLAQGTIRNHRERKAAAPAPVPSPQRSASA